ncbi:MAG: phosphoribosyl-AMP cyclohydrolase [Pirellulaceae bacterium]|nr:MAG: phosphoribosyl-AMP cyclohydrolase [Pirellulaceae bacterium]
MTHESSIFGTDRVPDFQKHPLIPVVAQDIHTGRVLMVAYMNEEAFNETLRTGQACYYSRSRGRLWRKGEESGHIQRVRELYIDCDGDTLLIKVEQLGEAACHEGYRSCFFRRYQMPEGVWGVVEERVFDPQVVYGSAATPPSGPSPEMTQKENGNVESA